MKKSKQIKANVKARNELFSKITKLQDENYSFIERELMGVVKKAINSKEANVNLIRFANEDKDFTEDKTGNFNITLAVKLDKELISICELWREMRG